MAGANFLASGPITPSSFVKLDSSNSNQVLQCVGSGDQPYGISQEFPRYPAVAPGVSTLAAVEAGDMIAVFQATDICLLASSSAGWTAGQFLMSNSSGQGIAVTGSNPYGAIALETVTGGALGKVAVVFGPAN